MSPKPLLPDSGQHAERKNLQGFHNATHASACVGKEFMLEEVIRDKELHALVSASGPTVVDRP
jgi:hypothetical protein